MHFGADRESHESEFVRLNAEFADILNELNTLYLSGDIPTAYEVLLAATRTAAAAERELVGAGPGGIPQTQEILFRERLKVLDQIGRQVMVRMTPPSVAAKALPLALTAAAAVLGAVLLG